MPNRKANKRKISLVYWVLFSVLFSGQLLSAGKGGWSQASPVVISEARSQFVAPSISVPGTVASKQQSELPSEVAGRLTWVADVGTAVNRGDVVARLDAKLFRLKLEENKAALKREQARLAYLKNELARQKQLLKSDFSSKTELEKIQLDYDVALSELAVARARVEIDEETLRQYTIRAPFSGVITHRQRREGEWVSSGESVVTFSNPDQLEIIARINEVSVRFVQLHSRLPINRGNENLTGVVRAIVPIGDAQSHLFEIRVDVAGNNWMAGQVVRVDVPTAEAREVLTVPRDALVLRSSGASVYRINEENKAEKISVTTGIASGNYIQVFGDIASGDKVVVRGGERLRPGQEVMVSTEKQS